MAHHYLTPTLLVSIQGLARKTEKIIMNEKVFLDFKIKIILFSALDYQYHVIMSSKNKTFKSPFETKNI